MGQEKHLPAWAVTVPGALTVLTAAILAKPAGACLQDALLGWTRCEGSPKQLAFLLLRLEVWGQGWAVHSWKAPSATQPALAEELGCTVGTRAAAEMPRRGPGPAADH